MAQRMFGLETEYAFAALAPDGVRVSQEQATSRLMELACATLPHLIGRESPGIFLQNGSRFYLDTGRHPELSTCEVLDPWDACRYAIAGDRILDRLAQELPAFEPSIQQVFISRSNVGYSSEDPSTWAAHESYGHRANPARLPDEMIPHLISRLIYTGAGGFDNRSPGIQFMLSPRVAHLEQVISHEATFARGVFHTKDESLSVNGYHRLHLACGESLCSQTALWLKTAVTALVVAMIEVGLKPCDGIQLQNPLGAMQRFAQDTTCTATADDIQGRRWTALDIQRQILGQLENHLGHPVMPTWAGKVCRRLRQVLDRLEQGPGAVAKTLDWGIKLAVYRDFASHQGIDWEMLPEYNEILAQARPAPRQADDRGLLLRRILARRGIPPHTRAPHPNRASDFTPEQQQTLESLLKQHGLSWDDCQAVLRLRQQLFELDTRFSQLGEQGLFAALDRAGVLDHQIPGVVDIEHAVTQPPAAGRARLRGLCVQRLSGLGGHYSCDWTGVWDHREQRRMDLSDPFSHEETWKPIREPEAPARPDPHRVLGLFNRAQRLYDEGCYEAAYAQLQGVCRNRRLLNSAIQDAPCRLCAVLRSRRGELGGPESLTQLRTGRDSFSTILENVATYRFLGLTPHPKITTWIRKGVKFLRCHPETDQREASSFHEHYGHYLLCKGRLQEARRVLERITETALSAPAESIGYHRALATLGEVHRRLGDTVTALHLVERAAAEQGNNGWRGDMANFSLMYLAKLQAQRETALAILRQAETIQVQNQDRVGEARTLLIEARLAGLDAGTHDIRQRILSLKEDVPVLSQCRLLAKILSRWDAWAGNRLSGDGTGDVFWGV